MATFKVGQRVKRIAHHTFKIPLGATGTIARELYEASGPTVDVQWDSPTLSLWCIGVDARTLAPLTDPGADAFLESIRKLKPLHEEPKVERKKFVEKLYDWGGYLKSN